ncbi:hypothetical protein C8Q78DRAFT_740529 [Trametes maxima]|nr:hypothetical protein C8Q78DRAFT_740529 [Trametes maxima]
MSGVDDLCACIAACFSCCFLGCNEASGIWCFYRSCGCRSRKTMNDKDFENTVEELYTHNKFEGDPAAVRAHVIELQPLGGPATGKDTVNTQPARRTSMEARTPAAGGGGGGERVPGEPRSERRDRTREWVHAHSASEPAATANAQPRPRSRSRSRPPEHYRSKSHADTRSQREREREPRTPGGSMRGPRAQAPPGAETGHAQQPSDAQAYVHAVEDAWKRSEESERPLEGSRERNGAQVDMRGEAKAEGENENEREERLNRPASPPRLDIPMSLRPGRPLSFGAPAQPPSPPQAVGDSSEKDVVGAR